MNARILEYTEVIGDKESGEGVTVIFDNDSVIIRDNGDDQRISIPITYWQLVLKANDRYSSALEVMEA